MHSGNVVDRREILCPIDKGVEVAIPVNFVVARRRGNEVLVKRVGDLSADVAAEA